MIATGRPSSAPVLAPLAYLASAWREDYGKKNADILQRVRMGEGTDPGMRNSYMPATDAAVLTDQEVMLISQYLMGVS